MTTDLLTIAEAQIAEKQQQEMQALKERLEKDKEILKEAINLVNTHTLYKRVRVGISNYKTAYKLATEEMLKEDYLKKPKFSSEAGIHFDHEFTYDRCYTNKGILKVNGETYYDIRYALNHYEKMVEDKETELLRLNDKIRDIKNELEELNKTFPSLKQAIQEWQMWEEETRRME